MRAALIISTALAAVLATAAPAIAHHSFAAEFDIARPVKLSGPVTKLEWTNPHSHLFVTVTESDGRSAEWVCEASPPNVLARRGLGRSVLHIGDTLTVEGFRAKDASNNGFGQKVTYPDGRNVFTASAPNQQ